MKCNEIKGSGRVSVDLQRWSEIESLTVGRERIHRNMMKYKENEIETKKAGHARTPKKSRRNFGENRDFVPMALNLFD